MRRVAEVLLAASGLAVLFFVPLATAAQESGAAPVSAGERAFQKCYACHSLGAADEGAQGPSLKGIVDRPVASWSGYNYSPAMRAFAMKQPRWTREALDAFLADPQNVVPDNEMGFFGVTNPAERGALIGYLADGTP